jgi:hypothetical protein
MPNAKVIVNARSDPDGGPPVTAMMSAGVIPLCTGLQAD